MGLQVTAANKRKHEITFEGKDVNTYTTSPPPLKACKWSNNNNNYIDALEEQKCKKVQQNVARDNSENNNNNENTSCGNSCTNGKEVIKSSITITTTATPTTTPTTTSTQAVTEIQTTTTTTTATATATVTTTLTRTTATTTVSLLPLTSEVSATTPLPPTSSTQVPEDSIAKLEVVAAAPLSEPWTTTTAASVEPVDCISKLQAVAVPSDPWGSMGTRSTLATTLLSTDELDDDDDDFEDDYEEEEGLIPTYCALRYHPFSGTSSNGVGRSNSGYVPSSSYGSSRPNYYSEPFPQQNCARTNNTTHMRILGPNGTNFQWSNVNQYYMMPESAYAAQTQEQQPPQQQQTIRCAENGKSYLELGCSSTISANSSTQSSTQILHHQPVLNGPPTCSFVPMSACNGPLEARHAALKRCCDARSGGVWCAATTTASKNCYKDIRLKIRNLSMFKLSRFRQVSEQSLYRSVLICNTLKRIDREIEAEAKEMHQAAAAAAAAHAHAAAAAAQHHGSPSYVHHQMPPHLSGAGGHHMQQHHIQQQQQQAQQQHMQQQQQHHQEYAPVMSCARLASMEYQVPLQHHHQQQQQQHLQQQHYQQQQHYLGQNGCGSDILDSVYFNSNNIQKISPFLLNSNNNNNNTNTNNNSNTSNSNSSSNNSNNNNNNSSSNNSSNNSNCDTTTTTTTNGGNCMHQYDHYPFRESSSGRATPYPCQFTIATTPTTTTTPSITATPTAPAIIVSQISTNPTPATTEINATTVSATTTSTTSNNKTITTTATTTNSNSSSSSSSVVVVNSNTTKTVDFAVDAADVVDDDATRSSTINWSSVLSLSSQSALDPLNNNDLFAILPPAANPAIAVPVSVCTTTISTTQPAQAAATAAASTTSVITTAATGIAAVASSSVATPPSSSTTATFTTLSTISSATHSLTSSYVSSMNAANGSSSWEYGFLDMEFGLGTEFTELMPPSCKLNSDDLFKNALTPVSTSRYSSVHENEMEQPAHIMVGS